MGAAATRNANGCKLFPYRYKDFNLPLLDEPIPPMKQQYSKDHTKKWSVAIAELDGFIFVTPEYNHSTSGALKNAIDFLYNEWNNKACAFVSYGSALGARAVEHLRLIAGELKMADIRSQVMLSLHTDFENYKTFKPSTIHEKSLSILADDLVAWSAAMKSLRNEAAIEKRPTKDTLQSAVKHQKAKLITQRIVHFLIMTKGLNPP